MLLKSSRAKADDVWIILVPLALSPKVRRLLPWNAWFGPKISFVSTKDRLPFTLLQFPENGSEDSWSRSGNTWLCSKNLFECAYCTWNLLFALFWMEPSFGIFQRSLWDHNLFIFQKLFIIDLKMNFLFLFVSYALSDQIAWNRLGNNSKNKFYTIRVRRTSGFSVCLRLQFSKFSSSYTHSFWTDRSSI